MSIDHALETSSNGGLFHPKAIHDQTWIYTLLLILNSKEISDLASVDHICTFKKNYIII